MNYRERLTKTDLTLPSGAMAIVRKMNTLEVVSMTRGVADAETGVQLAKSILLNKVVSIDGMKVVEAVADKDREVGIYELTQDDIDCIAKEVLGMGKRDEEARKTFPETEQKNGNNGSQPGEIIRADTNEPASIAS